MRVGYEDLPKSRFPKELKRCYINSDHLGQYGLTRIMKRIEESKKVCKGYVINFRLFNDKEEKVLRKLATSKFE